MFETSPGSNGRETLGALGPRSRIEARDGRRHRADELRSLDPLAVCDPDSAGRNSDVRRGGAGGEGLGVARFLIDPEQRARVGIDHPHRTLSRRDS